MRPSSEARIAIGVLLALQLITSTAAVGLLGRMSPAVDQILRENVYSTEAVEDMLAVLSKNGDQAEFKEALARARGNITEEEEGPLIEAIAASSEAALAGDVDARAEVTTRLRELGSVNRDSMRRADEAARLMGFAGAWTMALLGFASFLVSVVVYRGLETRLLGPILEMDTVLAAVRGGDLLRRCTWVAHFATGGRLVANLNWLLDQRLGAVESVAEDRRLRDAVLALLDRETSRPVLVLGADGRVVAVNKIGLSTTSEQGAWPEVATAVVAGEDLPGWTLTRLESGVCLAEGPLVPVEGQIPED